MKNVLRHEPPDLEQVEDDFAYHSNDMSDCFLNARREPWVLSSIMESFLRVTQTGSVVDPDNPLITESLECAAVAGAVFFATCQAAGKPASVSFDGHEKITYRNYEIDKSMMNAERWLKTFFVASICRRDDLIRGCQKTGVNKFAALRCGLHENV